MLDTVSKVDILRRNGIVVPARPAPETEAWKAAVDALFDLYVVQRAAHSLRQAEEACDLELMNRLAATSYQRRRVTYYA
ncbi:hypothetical protein [Variovorax sp. JS1663]|uniref:hypothetical protein n=1 Tax=Variovorax sp. JS1663 TaxID=1851577 RepID=UPI000B345D58|nr:hypothetical protein [Variovorax sp. JS1663]OUM02212.1 hypothetical protein A8M77_12565 [Variovorax sp. JS1663]